MLKHRIPAFLLMILGPTALGIVMLYARTTDDIPTLKDTVAFFFVAAVCFGVALFFLCWMIRDILRSRKNRHRNSGHKKIFKNKEGF